MHVAWLGLVFDVVIFGSVIFCTGRIFRRLWVTIKAFMVHDPAPIPVPAPAPYHGSFNSRGITCDPARERVCAEAREHLEDNMKTYDVHVTSMGIFPRKIEARSNAEAILAVRDYINGRDGFGGVDAYADEGTTVVFDGELYNDDDIVFLQERTVLRAEGLLDLAPGRMTARAVA